MSAVLTAFVARAARLNALHYSSFYDGVIYNSPYFYYRLGETSSSSKTMSDSSGNGRNGLYNPYPSSIAVTGLISGDANGAVNIAESSSNYAAYTYPGYSGPNNTSGCTIQLLVQPSGAHNPVNGGGIVFTLCNDPLFLGFNSGCPELVVVDQSSTHFKWQINSPGYGVKFLSSGVYAFGQTYLVHLRVQPGGASADMFINGNLAASFGDGVTTIFSHIADLPAKLIIGGAFYSAPGDYPFKGVVDEFALYPRPLTNAEIHAFAAVM